MRQGLNWSAVAIVVASVSGCAHDVVLHMQPPVVQQTGTAGSSLATVTVLDTRQPGVASSKRESLGTPMGNITFDPPEAQLVKQDLEAELSRLMAAKGITHKETFSALLSEFGVNTQSTAMYWDCVAKISLVLKHGNQEFPLTGTGTERTYTWPGDEVLRKAVVKAFEELNAGLGPVVEGL